MINLQVHFIIKNKDVCEDYFAEALVSHDKISFEKDDVKTEFTIISDSEILLKRKGIMNYTQRFSLKRFEKGNYEIMGLSVNIKVFVTKINISELGFFIEYDQYLDDSFEGKVKLYLKY